MFEHDVIITGTHSKYIKILKDESGLFARNLDVYMLAPILGFINNRKGKKNNEDGAKTTIQAQQFSDVKDDCELVYRLIMLLDDDKCDKDERLNRAFRYDSDAEKKAEFENNMATYNSYVLGGIEYIYEVFADGCVSKDDYIERIYQTVLDFREDCENIDYEEEIKKYL
ncbi:hypothetical protein [Lacrimispora saccharolytica]|uniref:hypothetical protein n=1 Tax=Lacrimispora saccharolytica TaxID=84030 RepID=UPI00265CA8D3|nr:hypothetical protein [Lacrimispora saccharolytica]MCF2657509.1 hypothetical protein [Lacrimispora saccharolytica]